MHPAEFTILAINPGSTSTKIAVFHAQESHCGPQPEGAQQPVFVRNIVHTDADLRPFHGRPVLDQIEYRQSTIEAELYATGYAPTQFHAVVGRGGLLRPLASGTYRVNYEMLAELCLAPYGEHAANLGAFLANEIAHRADCPAFIVDPVSVDELAPVARISGSALLSRPSLSHALNMKAVARRFAREYSARYEDLRLVVAHLGSGISISAHLGGRMIDINLAGQEGTFSTERSGGLPLWGVVDLCFSGKYTKQEMMQAFTRDGGMFSYLGTKDLPEVERRIAAGDGYAELIFEALAYQIGKDIGALATVLHGRIDAIVLTGGLAHSEKLIIQLRKEVDWIAPIAVDPGEDELAALAEGALSVLCGQRPALKLAPVSAPEPAFA